MTEYKIMGVWACSSTDPSPFPSFPLLFLRVRNIWIECRIVLPCTLIVRSALTILSRFGIDAVLILGVFSRIGRL